VHHFSLKPPSKENVQKYIASLSSTKGKKKIKIEYFGPLDLFGEVASETTRGKTQGIKKMGYGSPYLVVYRESVRGLQKKAILSTMRIGHGFGHDYRADRVDNQVLSFDTWNTLPQHCRVWDIGAFNGKGSELVSLGRVGEVFLLRPMVEGVEYYKDLDRIFENGNLESTDLDRAESLAKYLAGIHAKKYTGLGARELYERKIRDTVGHGECIFGLSDSYPVSTGNYLRENELEEIEKKCVSQRWKLKERSERLCQVHGDFHPWNILFKKSAKLPKFVVLDRSRGEWGEAADDVCALSINYLFYALRKTGEVKGEFLELFERFMSTYYQISKDEGLADSMPLFYVFRALVIASPIWYPDLNDSVRRKIFNFAQNILDKGTFDYQRVNEYFGDVAS